jgi:hypothetical protein
VELPYAHTQFERLALEAKPACRLTAAAALDLNVSELDPGLIELLQTTRQVGTVLLAVAT